MFQKHLKSVRRENQKVSLSIFDLFFKYNSVNFASHYNQGTCFFSGKTKMQIFQDTMKTSEESPGSENASRNHKWDRENPFEAPHDRRPLITDPVQPCRRTRAVVKGQPEKENH